MTSKKYLHEVKAIHRRGLVKKYLVIKVPASHLGGLVMKTKRQKSAAGLKEKSF